MMFKIIENQSNKKIKKSEFNSDFFVLIYTK